MARSRDPNRRALLLNTAMDLFSRSGFYAVSVKEIATEAKVSLGSMYTYFASKEELVNALYRRCKEIFSEYVTNGADQFRGRDAHKNLLKNLGRFIKDHPESFLFLETHHHADYLDQESLAIEESINDFALRFYVDKLDLRLTKKQAQLIISASFGAFVHVFKTSRIGRLGLDDMTLDHLELLLWHMATGGESKRRDHVMPDESDFRQRALNQTTTFA